MACRVISMSMNLTDTTQARLAVACILFSSTLWGLIWFPMRWFEQAGLPTVWTTLLMYLTAGLVSLPFVLRKKALFKNMPLDLLWLTLAAGAANLAFLTALSQGEVVRVMLLFFLSPLWTVVIGRWWLGEQLSRVGWWLLVVAMSGTVMMLWQKEIGAPWPHGPADWLALIAGIMFSLNNVLSRKLAAVPMELKTMAVFWGVVIVSSLVILFTQVPVPAVSASVWLAAALLGGILILAMTVSVLYGLARMPVYRSAVLMLFELIVAAVSAWLLTEEIMTASEWLGGALIIAAAYGVARLAKKY